MIPFEGHSGGYASFSHASKSYQVSYISHSNAKKRPHMCWLNLPSSIPIYLCPATLLQQRLLVSFHPHRPRQGQRWREALQCRDPVQRPKSCVASRGALSTGRYWYLEFVIWAIWTCINVHNIYIYTYTCKQYIHIPIYIIIYVY